MFRSGCEYYHLVCGRLLDEDGDEVNLDWPSFEDEQEAEEYLWKHEIRGVVRYQIE